MSMSLVGCQAYRRDVLFRLSDDNSANLGTTVSKYEGNYVIEDDDLLRVEVFTNKGERLIDPNFELQGGQGQQGAQQRNNYQYLVQKGGVVKLPIVGDQVLSGNTVDEAENLLEVAYNKFYKDAFVKMQLLNRRVVVLGDGGGQVIPLENENTTLLEVLALHGGLQLGAQSDQIRIIRGDLTNPEIFIVDLSSIASMQSTMVQIEPGDVIYIEPWRRPWLETFRDLSPIIGFTTSVLTLVFIFQRGL